MFQKNMVQNSPNSPVFLSHEGYIFNLLMSTKVFPLSLCPPAGLIGDLFKGSKEKANCSDCASEIVFSLDVSAFDLYLPQV